MKRVLLVLTSECNLKCSYCFQDATRPLRMHSDVLQAGVELAFSGTTPRTNLIFSGGEPLLEFEQVRTAVKYAKTHRTSGKSVRYRLSTNGLLLSPEVADFLEENKFNVQLSFDGLSGAQEHRRDGTFETLHLLLDSLRTRNADLWRRKLQVTMTILPGTVRHMAESVKYFLEKGVYDLFVAPCITHYPGWKRADIAELDTQVGLISDLSRSYLGRTGRVPVIFLRRVPGDRGDQSHEVCDGLRGETLVVDVDGEVYACPFFAESYQKFQPGSFMTELKVLRMGDVRDPDLLGRRATAAQAARKLVPPDWASRRYSSYGKCRDCRYLAECFICPVSIWNKPHDSDMFRVPDFICAFNQVVLKYRENFPCVPGARENRLFSDDADPIDVLAAYLRGRT